MIYETNLQIGLVTGQSQRSIFLEIARGAKTANIF